MNPVRYRISNSQIPRIGALFAAISFLVLSPAPVEAAQINLKNSSYPGVQEILAYFHRMRIGNEGRSTLDALTLDTDTGIIEGRGTIYARHSWGTINVPDGVSCRGGGTRMRTCTTTVRYRCIKKWRVTTCTRTDRVACPEVIPPRCDPKFRTLAIRASDTIPVWFKYDLTTGDIFGSARIPVGLKTKVAGKTYQVMDDYRLDLHRLERALDGDAVAIAEMIPTGHMGSGHVKVERTNEYNRIRNSYFHRYGRENVYFSSRRFTDWAKPEALFHYGAQAVLSGGSASPAIMHRIRSQTMKEVTALSRWLAVKGVQQPELIARRLLQGDSSDIPYLAAKWQTVRYSSRRHVGGRIVTPWVHSTHGGFAIIWQQR